MNIVLPFHAIEWNLGPENRKIMRNHQALWHQLSKYLADDNNIDPESPIGKILERTDLSEDLLMRDLFVFIFASTDTTSKALVSMFYYISKMSDV